MGTEEGSHGTNCQSHSAKWSTSYSASPYATTNVMPGYDIREVYMISQPLSRTEYMDGQDTARFKQRQQMDKKSDRVDITRMDKTAGKT